MTNRAILKSLGIGSERAKLLGVRFVTLKGVRFCYHAVSPLDFLGSDMHPLGGWAEASEFPRHKAIEEELKKAAMDPRRTMEIANNIRKAYTTVFLKAILHPPLSAEPETGKVCVSDLYSADMWLANELMRRITEASMRAQHQGPFYMSARRRLWSWMLSRIGIAPSPTSSQGYPTTTTP